MRYSNFATPPISERETSNPLYNSQMELLISEILNWQANRYGKGFKSKTHTLENESLLSSAGLAAIGIAVESPQRGTSEDLQRIARTTEFRNTYIMAFTWGMLMEFKM